MNKYNDNINRMLVSIKEEMERIVEKYMFSDASKNTADSIHNRINNMIHSRFNETDNSDEIKYFNINVELTDDVANIIPNNFWSALLMFGVYIPYLYLEIKKSISEDGKLEFFGYDNITYSYNIYTKELKYLLMNFINKN